MWLSSCFSSCFLWRVGKEKSFTLLWYFYFFWFVIFTFDFLKGFSSEKKFSSLSTFLWLSKEPANIFLAAFFSCSLIYWIFFFFFSKSSSRGKFNFASKLKSFFFKDLFWESAPMSKLVYSKDILSSYFSEIFRLSSFCWRRSEILKNV